MEGISKKRLEQITHWDLFGITSFELLSRLLDECTELDPWLPIDENTPEEVQLLVKFDDGNYEVAKLFDIHNEKCWVSNDGLDFDYGFYIPTHYKLLPEDPKE
jgi:hypothetical protein